MRFKRKTVTVNGDAFHLRELSAGAVEQVDQADAEYTQALTMLALSLCDADGEPMHAKLADGLSYVRHLPVSLVRDHLIPEATALNDGSLDGALGKSDGQ